MTPNEKNNNSRELSNTDLENVSGGIIEGDAGSNPPPSDNASGGNGNNQGCTIGIGYGGGNGNQNGQGQNNGNGHGVRTHDNK